MKLITGLLLMLTLSSGCATIGTGSNSCAGFKPILLERASIDGMTQTDARAVLAHNEFGRARCGW